MDREKALSDGCGCLSEMSRSSAIALLHDFVSEDTAGSSWSPLIDCALPLTGVAEGFLNPSPQSVSAEANESARAAVNLSSEEMHVKPSLQKRLRAHRVSSSLSASHTAFPGGNQSHDLIAHPSSAKLSSIEPWGRIHEPRLKRSQVFPGPGAYSPAAASKSSVAVKFGHAVNHKLPFRASYCDENFVSHRAIPDEDKLFGKASAFSFTRHRRVSLLNPATSHQQLSATCSPYIGPGTYNVPLDMMCAHTSAGHLIPIGPRGSDLRSFRNNRALKHTYSKGQSDAAIGMSVLALIGVFKFLNHVASVAAISKTSITPGNNCSLSSIFCRLTLPPHSAKFQALVSIGMHLHRT